MGITCAAALAEDESTPRLFYSLNPDSRFSSQMRRADLSGLVDYLLEKTDAGYTIVTHNGLGFDLNVLAEESGRLEDCKKLALSHVDIMFHFFCGKGFAVGLNAAAKAIGLSKPPDVDGSSAPKLWRDDSHRRVLDYVAQDCSITLEVARTSEKNRSFQWVTGRGSVSNFDIPDDWLPVIDAMSLPLPDTSWMNDPWPRSKFTDWLG